MEHTFGEVPPFRLGVEEELLLVDRATYDLAHRSVDVLAQLGLPDDAAKLEFYAALIEFASPIAKTADEATVAISQRRHALGATDTAAIGAGLHPAARYGDVEAVPKPRWLAVADVHGRANFRSVEAALHVHVGMPDPPTAVRVFDSLRHHLALLLALSANSPFWFGSDARLDSARSVQNRAFSRFDMPPGARSYDEYCAAVSAVMAAAQLSDYTLIWWHVRVHPRLGTVEVRVMDSQASLDRVAGLAALVHGLALHAAERPPVEPLARAPLAESLHMASRYGLDARLWGEAGLRPVREAAAEAIAIARSALRDVGGEDPLEGVERILREGNGATQQRRAYRRGGMREVLRHLVDTTAAGYP